ncbi:MAG: tripartite tricarboxylate transporter permease, partial [Rhizobiaceae bacterium]
YRSGKAGKAMKTAAVASVCGDLIGDMLLIFAAVWIASFTEGLGPPELFSVYLTAFIVISSVVGSSIIKGLISTSAGIIVATIGTDPITAGARLDFGILNFQSGMSLVPLLIGMFVLSELALQIEKSREQKSAHTANVQTSADGNRLSLAEFVRILPIMLRSSAIGAVIGILPGLGSSVAAFAAYGEEKRRAKNPDVWGTGIVEGIAAPESANNAVSGPTMIPLLALGVPGSTIAAILMGVFLIHGIPIGPQIFITDRELVFGLFAAGLLGISIYGMIGFFGSTFIGNLIARIPTRLIFPYIFLTCFISAYSARTSVFDVFILCVAGFVGYLMRKGGYSTAAFIIAFVLTRGAEETLRQSLLLSNDGALIFLQRPIALFFFAFGILVVAGRLWQKRQQNLSDPDNQKVTGSG